MSLRLPAELHARLTDSASGRRSLNAEIIARLEASYEYESKTAADIEALGEQGQEHENVLTDHERRIEKLERWVVDLRDRTGEDMYNDPD